MDKKFKVLIGVDPEFFLVRRDVNVLVSAHGLVPGTKLEPHKIRNGAVQLDGTAVEFNTKPVSTAKQFVRMNKSVLSQIRKMVPKKYEFAFEPTVEFDKFYFKDSIPETQKELGCTPDYNAWTGEINPAPAPPKNKPTMRTASGHIHIGWTSGADVSNESHFWDCCALVKQLDVTVGKFIHHWDKDTQRAKLYGKWGAFRPKPYGVEWRVPSNAWLAHPVLWEWLFNAVKCVTEGMRKGQVIESVGSEKGNLDNYRLHHKHPERTVAYIRKFYPDFPDFPAELDPDKTSKKEEPKAPVLEPVRGVRVAASQANAAYDLDLDIPYDGTNNYTTPSALGVSDSDDDDEDDGDLGDSAWD